MISINTFDTHLHMHEIQLSPASQNPLTITKYNSINSDYVSPAKQIPINTMHLLSEIHLILSILY